MLQTTVNYLSVVEGRRHNLETERQGREQLFINSKEAETHANQLLETIRHNQVTEHQGYLSLAETQRHNQTTEMTNLFDAATRRMQLSINQQEADTHRYSAVQSAGIGWANVGVAQQNADINQQNANTAEQRMRNEFVTNYLGASSSQSQAATAAKRADTDVTYYKGMLQVNKQNAESNARQASVAESNQELREAELEWKKKFERDKLKWQMYIDNKRVGVELFKSLVSGAAQLKRGGR